MNNSWTLRREVALPGLWTIGRFSWKAWTISSENRVFLGKKKSGRKYGIKYPSLPFLLSGTWPGWCPEHGQLKLAMSRTSIFDVRNKASFSWPCTGHRPLMSGIWPVSTGRVPDIDFVTKFMSGIRPVKSGTWPVMSGMWPVMSGIGPVMSGLWSKILVTFRTSHDDVRNMARKSWPYSGHRNLMSGIWPVYTGHVPDINVWCPEYGQFILALFQTSMSFPGHIPDIIGLIPDISFIAKWMN